MEAVEDLLHKHAVEFAQVESRTKKKKSFLEKVQRKGKDYENPLLEITDLVGIRVVAYYKEDVDRIGKILKEEFDVDEADSMDKADAMDPDRFGYLSVHYVVNLKPPRRDLTEWKDFGRMKAEIQVITFLKHAWATIDHKLRYKTEEEMPKNLKRQLFRLSALLEIADNEFSDLRESSDKLEARYSHVIERGLLDITINISSLPVYFATTKRHVEWVRKAQEVGFEHVPDLETDPYFDLYDQRSRLAKILRLVKVRTLGQLSDILDRASEWGKDVLARIHKTCTVYRPAPQAVPLDIILMLVLYDRRELLVPKRFRNGVLVSTEFHTGILEGLREVIKDVGPPWVVSTDASTHSQE